MFFLTKKRREFDDTFSLLSHREELFFLALPLEKKQNVTQHEKTFLFRVFFFFLHSFHFYTRSS